MSEPVLDASDLKTVTWRKIKKHLDARIAALREKNDNPLHGADKTALIRGQIKELRNLAALGTAPQTDADDADG